MFKLKLTFIILTAIIALRSSIIIGSEFNPNHPAATALRLVKERIEKNNMPGVYGMLDLFRYPPYNTVWFINEPVDNQGNTLLHYANKIGNEQVVWAILESGADVNIRNKSGELALSPKYFELEKKAQDYLKEKAKKAKELGY